MHAAMHIGVRMCLVLLDRAQHRARALCGCRAVEVHERMPVRSEERRVGKEWNTDGTRSDRREESRAVQRVDSDRKRKAATEASVSFQAEDGIRDLYVTGVQTCALPISRRDAHWRANVSRTARPRAAPRAGAVRMPRCRGTRADAR